MKTIVLKGLVAAGIIGSIVFSGISFTGRDAMNTVKAEVVDLVKDKSDLNGEITKLKEALKGLHTEATRVIGDNEEEHGKLEAAIKDLEGKITSLEKQISLKDKEIDLTNASFVAKISNLTNEIFDLRAALDNKTLNMDKLTTKFNNLIVSFNGVQNSLSSEIDAHNQTKEDLATANSDKSKLEATQTELVNEINKLNSDATKNKLEIKKLSSQLADVQAELKNKNLRISELEKQLADITAKHDTAVANVFRYKGLYDGAIRELNALKASGRPEDRDRIATLEGTVRELEGQINILQSKVNELEPLVEQAKGNDTHNTKASGDIQKEIKRLEGEVKEANDAAAEHLREVKNILSDDNVKVSDVKKAVEDALARYSKIK